LLYSKLISQSSGVALSTGCGFRYLANCDINNSRSRIFSQELKYPRKFIFFRACCFDNQAQATKIIISSQKTTQDRMQWIAAYFDRYIVVLKRPPFSIENASQMSWATFGVAVAVRQTTRSAWISATKRATNIQSAYFSSIAVRTMAFRKL
jgi:hypothetical protein